MNTIKNHNSNLEAIILAGGLGTRLSSKLKGTPKCLALVNDRPFIDKILKQLESNYIYNICIATGYLSEQIEDYILTRRKSPLSIRISREDEPLGTGGALKYAIKSSSKDNFIILNGDTYFDINLDELITENEFDSTIVTTKIEQSSRYGIVKYSSNHLISNFSEKSKDNQIDINTGIYLFNKSLLSHMPNDSFSLEKETFPKMVLEQALNGIKKEGTFIDIGTPEDLERANKIIP